MMIAVATLRIEPAALSDRLQKGGLPATVLADEEGHSDARTRRGSMVRGKAIPCLASIILIHMHRALWMWAAIIRTVRRGTPGTVFRPHREWQVLYEIHGHAIVRSPRGDQGAARLQICGHVRSPAVS